MNPIAKRIQDARLKAGMTEKELAKKCGLSPAYIQQIESGKKIINETAAASILKVFGETVESAFGAYLDESDKQDARPEMKKVVQKPEQKPEQKPVQPQRAEPVQVEPTDQWAGALSGIIKTFPIIDLASGKRLGQKELPVLNKKIEGIPWEKLQFFAASDNQAEAFRISKGDVLWVQEMGEVQQAGMYIVARQNVKMIVHIRKEYGQLVLSKAPEDKKPETVDTISLRIIGRCMKAEFGL